MLTLPDIELGDSARGEDSETADCDEDNAGPESLTQCGEMEVNIVTETDHHLAHHTQNTNQDLSQSQLVYWVVSQPCLQHQGGGVSLSCLSLHATFSTTFTTFATTVATNLTTT